WQEAVGLLEASAGQLPLLADYSLYLAASAHQGLGQKPQAIDLLSRLLLEHPSSLLAERAERERASLFADVNLLPAAEKAYRDYLSRASDASQRREVMLALAEILLKEGRQGESEGLLRQLWLKWPGNREAARAGELLSAMPEAPPFTPDEQFDRALALHNSGQHTQAVAAFSPFLDGSTPRASRARLLSGISRFHLRDYHLAISVLSPMTKEASSLRSEALYWIGRSYGRLDDREKAIATLTRLADVYPRSAWGDDSLYMVALNYSEDRNPKRAVEALSRLIREHPSSDLVDTALWARAWINYRQSALTTALHDLQRLQKGAPSPSRLRVQASYWRARILEQLGRKPEALRAYRALLETFSDEYYYIEQTRLRLDRLAPSAGRVVTATSLKIAVPSPPEPLPATSAPQATKARLLKDLNLREEASEEFWALTRRSLRSLQRLPRARSHRKEPVGCETPPPSALRPDPSHRAGAAILGLSLSARILGAGQGAEYALCPRSLSGRRVDPGGKRLRRKGGLTRWGRRIDAAFAQDGRSDRQCVRRHWREREPGIAGGEHQARDSIPRKDARGVQGQLGPVPGLL
ncbi:MAG: hypothetical protein HW409_1282, partial [candidate division NC10 bacterium]|nr:hypothetical protein [candidate division NC10 bacterium]